MAIGMLGIAVMVFLLSWWLTRWLCDRGPKLTLLDLPNERSLHTKPTLRTGGLAILGSLAAGILLGLIPDWPGAIWLELNRSHVQAGVWIGGMVILLAGISYWDDRKVVQPWLRLAIHAIAAAGVIRWGGLMVGSIPVPLLGRWVLGWLAVPFGLLLAVWARRLFHVKMGLVEGAAVMSAGFVAYVMATGGPLILSVLTMVMMIVAVMWMCNLYNFMDGMDGFAGGMTVIGHVVMGYLAWKGGHQLIAIVSLLTVVATGGFLIHNFPPARIFMGDVGSIPLGFLAGTLAALGVHDKLFDAWVPVLIFSPFIVDATVALVRRMLQGRKIWQSHREHWYQRLVLAGWSHRQTVMAEYALMLACGGLAVLYDQAGEAARLAVLAGWVMLFAALAWGVRVVERQQAKGSLSRATGLSA